jgi:uncharacterized protein YkuJ
VRSERRALLRLQRRCRHLWIPLAGDEFDELRRDFEKPGVQVVAISFCSECSAMDVDVVFLSNFGRVSEGA